MKIEPSFKTTSSGGTFFHTACVQDTKGTLPDGSRMRYQRHHLDGFFVPATAWLECRVCDRKFYMTNRIVLLARKYQKLFLGKYNNGD